MFKMSTLPVYNIQLGGAAGILKMSLVEDAAVCKDFLAFNSQEKKMMFSIDEEKRIVFGCALRADFPIYRNDKQNGEYYVVFSKQVINDLYEKFMIEGKQNDVNLNHSADTDKCYLIQSFLKDSEKGISPTGFEDCADGSWFCAYKVQNDDVWEKVKSGNFNGFSVEGYFVIDKTHEQELEDYVKSLLV